MTYHACPVCGEEDGIEMRCVAGPDYSVNAGAEYDLVAMHCGCPPEDVTPEQWEKIDYEAQEKDWGVPG